MILADITNDAVFSAALVFCRIGTACMFLPTIGEANIHVRIRLLVSLILSILVYPTVTYFPEYNSSVIFLTITIFQEVLLGSIIGLSAKMMIITLHILGTTIASMSSLASAMRVDPSLDMQGSIFGNFLTITFLTLMFATDQHLLIIKSLANSYNIFAIGDVYKHYENIIEIFIKTNALAFNVGIKLALPFVIISVLLYTCYGLLVRVIPQFQIFFLIMPMQVAINTFIFMLSFSGTLLWFLTYYETFLNNMFSG